MFQFKRNRKISRDEFAKRSKKRFNFLQMGGHEKKKNLDPEAILMASGALNGKLPPKK